VVERHAQGDPGAAIVSRYSEALEPQCAHHLELVLGHRALRIRSVITAAGGLVAVAVAAQVRTDDREMLREHGSHPVPHDVRLWIAVQEQDRRPTAAATHIDRDPVRLDRLGREVRKHSDLVPKSPVV
jgi:hypothetical protein